MDMWIIVHTAAYVLVSNMNAITVSKIYVAQQNHAYNTVCNGCRKIASFLWVYRTVHSLCRCLV